VLAASVPSIKGERDWRTSIAHQYAQLGWADRALEAAGDDVASREKISSQLAAALLTGAPTASAGPAIDARACELLGGILEKVESGKSALAVPDLVRLSQSPGAQEALPIAQRYFSRAGWTTKWFPCPVDPQDATAWQAAAAATEAVTVPVRTLSFPYRKRSPRELLLSAAKDLQLPAAAPFGMVASAQVASGSDRWRISVSGGGGVRVVADGKTLIERWSDEGEFHLEAECESPTGDNIQLHVEHFVGRGIPERFEVTMEPVLEVNLKREEVVVERVAASQESVPNDAF
jgi:hypothetical protein